MARSHAGLGRALHAAGDTGAAEAHWHQALTLYTELDSPDADEIRRLLDPSER
jgi:hypothetical protein